MLPRGASAFIGLGANSWQGVYIAIPNGPIGGYPPSPVKVADLTTPIPGGVGNFTCFAMMPWNPRVNGQAVAFIGLGAEGQQGIYVAWPPSPFYPPSPVKVADTYTLIPGDSLGRTFARFSDIAWHSSGKPNCWATNSFPSNRTLHNELTYRRSSLEAIGNETQAASQTVGLPTRSHRTERWITN